VRFFRTQLGLSAVILGLLIACLPATEGESTRNADAVLQVGKLRVGKVLFLGNSITLHGPAENIGWTGNWGMAASASEKDYVHQLLARISKQVGGTPKVMVRNIADFERNLSEYKIGENLKAELAFEADVVILAIGENAAAPKTDEDRARFAAALTQLLAELKAHGRPALFVRSSFWEDAEKDKILKKVCGEAGGTFIDIGALGRDEANYARSERKIEHAGVAAHPGDQGMEAITEALWKALRKAGEAR
jgi:hypothetical protein